MTHYAQPALSGLHSDLESVTSERKRLIQEAINNEDSAIASGGDADDSTVTSSYTSRFMRRSPQRYNASQKHESSPLRMYVLNEFFTVDRPCATFFLKKLL